LNLLVNITPRTSTFHFLVVDVVQVRVEAKFGISYLIDILIDTIEYDISLHNNIQLLCTQQQCQFLFYFVYAIRMPLIFVFVF